MPPVSMTVKGWSPSVHSVTMRSRVTPGWSWTMEILRPAKRLKRADLPTFGRPTMAAQRVTGRETGIGLGMERKGTLGNAG